MEKTQNKQTTVASASGGSGLDNSIQILSRVNHDAVVGTSASTTIAVPRSRPLEAQDEQPALMVPSIGPCESENEQPASIEDLDVLITQCKAKRDTRKPLSQYTLHLLPQPLPPTKPLPPVDDPPSIEELPPSSGSLPSPSMEPHHMPTDLDQQYNTGQNMFGLLQKYLAPNPPDHDPEILPELTDLSDEIVDNSDSYHGLTVPNLVPITPVQSEKYGPYPNHSVFQIGEWYWAQGKSLMMTSSSL
ncbi:hypothetical protein HWV62_34429 [Athelia sp. TMB]|nr:hypothetical protein HWV62_34429 [Athelia sp. TMB]